MGATTETATVLTSDAWICLGLILQAAAVIWVWKDWEMSQWHYDDWRREHRREERNAVSKLQVLLDKFAGPRESDLIDVESAVSDDLTEFAKLFPHSNDATEVFDRKIASIGRHYGVGPSNDDLRAIQATLTELALIRRGVKEYRATVRKSTFTWSIGMILIGFALQIIGSWPDTWVVEVPKEIEQDAVVEKRTN